jgi:exopolysaccharide production protein ExoQ
VSADIIVPQPASLASERIRGLAFSLGFFFSFRQVIVLLSVRLFGVEPWTGSALSLALDLVLLGLICLDSLGGRRRSTTAIVRLPSVRWVLLFLAFTFCSLAWSETASLTNSFAYWLGLAIDAVNVFLLLRDEDGTDAAHSLMKGFIWSSCILAVVAWAMPVQADLRLGDEDFFNTNEIANVCALAIFFTQYLSRRGRESWRFVTILLVLTLIRTLSKSTFVAFLVSQIFLLVVDRATSRKAKLGIICFGLVAVLIFWQLFAAYYDTYTTTGNQAETLTGRTAIWLYVAGAAFDHPWTFWIGHGFDSWWKVVPPFGSEMFEARHAENELLQQFYAYGVTGVALLAGIYGSLLRQLRRLKTSSARAPLLAFLLFIVVRGLAVADAFDLLLPLWSVLLISVVADRENALNPGLA